MATGLLPQWEPEPEHIVGDQTALFDASDYDASDSQQWILMSRDPARRDYGSPPANFEETANFAVKTNPGMEAFRQDDGSFKSHAAVPSRRETVKLDFLPGKMNKRGFFEDTHDIGFTGEFVPPSPLDSGEQLKLRRPDGRQLSTKKQAGYVGFTPYSNNRWTPSVESPPAARVAPGAANMKHWKG